MNWRAVWAIYVYEMKRFFRTLGQSLVSPVVSTVLYFVVFGAAIGSRIQQIDGVSYGAFIVPGLIMLSLLTQSVTNASFGIYFPRFSGTIYEFLAAPVAATEMVMGFVGAAATKALIIGLIILGTSAFFVPLSIAHPFWMIAFLLLTAITFSLFGFIIGLWADGFEKLQIIPLLVITPLTFLGGSFYSINVLPPFWRTISLFNPVVYLVSGFRWSFNEVADVNVAASLGMTMLFLVLCLAVVGWIFRTGSVYGTIAAPLAIMLWIFVATIAVFVGITVNATIVFFKEVAESDRQALDHREDVVAGIHDSMVAMAATPELGPRPSRRPDSESGTRPTPESEAAAPADDDSPREAGPSKAD